MSQIYKHDGLEIRKNDRFQYRFDFNCKLKGFDLPPEAATAIAAQVAEDTQAVHTRAPSGMYEYHLPPPECYPYKYPALPKSGEISIDIRRDLEHLDGRADNFTSLLLRLIAKSDHFNKMRLSKSYPEEVLAVWMWHNGFVVVVEKDDTE